MQIGLIVDGLVAILLIVTIFYCLLLDRRLRALRSGQDGLKSVIAELDVATARAERAIGQLSALGSRETQGLEKAMRDARTLSDELSLMVEAGNNLADRLEGKRPRLVRPGDKAAQEGAPVQENPLLKALREAR